MIWQGKGDLKWAGGENSTFLSPYYVPVSMKYTSPMLFHLIIQPTPCSSDCCYLSRTNEQVGKPGRGKGFPNAHHSCLSGVSDPGLSLKWMCFHVALLVKNRGHKNDSASHPCPQVVHRRAMGKVNRYVTTV